MGWDKPTRVQIAGLALMSKGYGVAAVFAAVGDAATPYATAASVTCVAVCDSRSLPQSSASDPGAHVLIQAATGCGKTSCFCVASLCALEAGVPGPQVVVVVPNRPLAEEVHRVMSKLASEVTFQGVKGVRVAAAYGTL